MIEISRNIMTKLSIILLLAFNISCASDTVRPTIDENVHLYNSVNLSNKMHGMSEDLFVITTLTTQSSLTSAEHEQLVQKLRALSTKASSLGDGVTNYSVINQYMGAFIYDVELALQFANKNPPNYVPANRLIRSCISCHDT